MARINRTHKLFIFLSFVFIFILYLNLSSSVFGNQPYSLVNNENETYFPKCQLVNKISFLRTHKCGSTTIQNILFREAVHKKLKVALDPNIGAHTSDPMVLSNYTETLNRRNLTWLAGVEMDLLAEHFRWELTGKQDASKILGTSKFKIFTILRDPVDRFESLYQFSSMDKLFGLSLKQFIQLLQNNTFSNISMTEIKQKYRMKEKTASLAYEMALDLGLSFDSLDDEEAIDQLIAGIERDFDLVIIMERMDESLILLRHLLCLPIDNMTSLVINARKPEYKVQLNLEERKVLREHWLAADERIYRHFYNIFEKKVKAFGRSEIEEEIGMLRLANQKVKDRCIDKHVRKVAPKFNFPGLNPKAAGYFLTREPGCDLYGMVPQEFRKIFLKNLSNDLRPSLQDYNMAVKRFFN